MLQSISSPRREAASPPSPRCSDAKKANTLASLQLHKGSSSYNRNLDVTGGSLQLQDVPEYWHQLLDTTSGMNQSEVPTRQRVSFWRAEKRFACIMHRSSLAPISVLCSCPKSPQKRQKAALNNVAGEDSLPKQCRSRSRAYRQRCFFASQARIWACRLASHAQARVWACKYIPGPCRVWACRLASHAQARVWACRLASHAQARVWACKYIPGPCRVWACRLASHAQNEEQMPRKKTDQNRLQDDLRDADQGCTIYGPISVDISTIFTT
jgi:hypothetical protein